MVFLEVQTMSNPQSSQPAIPRRPNMRRSRRQNPKRSTRLKAFRNALGLGPNIAVSILDLSEGGVRLIVKEALKPKAEFEINLETMGSRTFKVIAQVVWTLPLADGNHCVGARFQKDIPYADLGMLATI
jgi:hypothetical protein